MKEYEKRLQEFQTLIGKDDAKSERRKDQIVEWLEQNGDDDAREKCKALVLQNLKRIDNDIATIRQKNSNAIRYTAHLIYSKALFQKKRIMAAPAHQWLQRAWQGIHA